MANRITNNNVNTDTLKLSNGGTDVFLSVLALSACDEAQSGWEKRFAQWIVDMDQSYRGLGTVGFDISEIGWDREAFEEQKQHVLKVIDMAANEHRWKDLSYKPVIKDSLASFRDMIVVFQKYHTDSNYVWALHDKDLDISLCPKHHVYLNVAGCIICNNKPVRR